jgi:phosphatidylglycerophosphate synthase
MPPAPEPDRRPIAARRLAFIQNTARWLATHRVSPNLISLVGMLGGITAGLAFAGTAWTDSSIAARSLFILAAACIQLRLLCNVIDGLVAVEGNMRSPVGEIYNEAPDRISDVATIVGAGYAFTGWPSMGYWVALLAVGTAYVRALGKGAGLPSDFSGPMAKQQRMAILTAGAVYVALAPASWQVWVQWDDHAPVGLVGILLALIAAGAILTCLRRLCRIVAGLRNRAAGQSGAP